VKRVLVSHEEAPVDDMERLIALAAADPVLTLELIDGASEVLTADPASLVPCWLAIVAGELGPISAELLLSVLGTSEGDALDAAIISALTRHARSFHGSIIAAIDDALPEDRELRSALYGILLALAGPDAASHHEDLRTFAERRQEIERGMPRGLGVPEAPALLAAALRPLADVGPDGAVPLARLRERTTEDWRMAARRIASVYGAEAATS
jgi:hypothetical protein